MVPSSKEKIISNNKFDKIFFMLTMKILLLNTDDLKHQLKNQKLVELAQKRYASMLHYYLKSQHLENHSTLLARGLMLVHDTQRVHEVL